MLMVQGSWLRKEKHLQLYSQSIVVPEDERMETTF
jgi:hypothetical protein